MRVVGGVGVAEVGVVVQEGVALGAGRGAARRIAARLQAGAEHVRPAGPRRAASSSSSAVTMQQEKSRARVEHRRATGAEQRVGHLAHDRVEAVREHGREHASRRRFLRGAFAMVSGSVVVDLHQVVAERGHGQRGCPAGRRPWSSARRSARAPRSGRPGASAAPSVIVVSTRPSPGK